MTSYYETYVKDYQKTPKGVFGVQRANAKRRGIEWKLTFEEWWEIWEKSGKWEQRGRHAEQYCMGRRWDTGAYEKGNVAIVTSSWNSRSKFFKSIK